MPSFGLPSSMPPVSPSLSPCLPTLLQSSLSSCSDSSSASVPDGCLNHLFEPPYLPRPPPLSLSEAAPYSPPPAYPPVFPYGPPLLPSTRFPPPPNSSFSQALPVPTFYEGPHSHYPPEPHTAYDRWSDRSVISTSYGSDTISKRFSHWPLSTFNSSFSNTSNNNNPSFGFLNPEPNFPPLAPYPPIDTITNLGPKFSPSPRDLSVYPNAAVMPSIPSASITSPLPSGHFSAFPPPNVPLDFPHSSRFPFNPHASTFIPGMDSAPGFGPGNSEFMPEPVPGYLSRTGNFQPPSAFQAPDYFHDASSRPIHSPETAPRPIRSNSPSCFFGSLPQSLHSPNVLSHITSSSSNVATGPLCSTSVESGLEPSSDLPAPCPSPYPPLLSGSLFSAYPSASPVYQDSFSLRREEERAERIVSDSGKLMFQHMSPEEWRWKHYESMFADALDPSGNFARVRPSGYNHFHGVDSTASNTPNGVVGREEGSSSGAQKSQKELLDILERSKVQNLPGPSLKLAASALAEMLALGPNAGSSSTSEGGTTSGTALTSDTSCPLGNATMGGQARSELMLEDCCSSSGSAVVHKEVNDGPLSQNFGGLIPEGYGYGAGLSLCSPTRCKREISVQPEDAFCDFGGAPASWAVRKPSGKSLNSSNHRPMSWVDGVPQSAKGGALYANGQRRVFSKGSPGIIKQPSVSSGPAKLHGENAESITSENFNNLFTQSSNISSRPQSGRIRNLCSPPIRAVSPEDPPSVSDPFNSQGTVASGLCVFDPRQEISPSGLGSSLPLDSSHNDQWHVKSTSCGSSPPLSQACLDLHGSISGQTTGGATGVLANLKWGCPEASNLTEVAYPGTGFHALTASISNLSKVLFSLDSSALTPPDSAVLEETLQSSILRLSECLLLEQSRINRNPATRFVGSDASSTSRKGRADGSITDGDLVRHAETDGSTNQGHQKASEVGDVSRCGSPASLCIMNELRAAAAIAAFESVDSGASIVRPHSLQRPFPLNNDNHSVSKCSMIDDDIKAGKCSLQNYNKTLEPSASHLVDAVADDVIQLLWENDILERASLERLIGAEAREAKLKVLVEELREELELERVENRGTAFLCEKIMQEVEVSKVKEVKQRTQSGDSDSKIGNVECNLQSTDSIRVSSSPERSGNQEPSGFSAQSVPMGNDREDKCESGEEKVSAANAKSSEEQFLNNIDHVESRLAVLRERFAVTEYPSMGEDICAAARMNRSNDGVLNKIYQLEPQPTPPIGPKAMEPTEISQETSGSVESRLALLLARSETVTAHLNAVYVASRDVEAWPAAAMLPKCSLEALIDTNVVEPQMTLQGLPIAIPAFNSFSALRVGDELASHPVEKEITSPSDICKDVDQVEARLALLHARPGWDNELGVFTETEPCSPGNLTAVDFDASRDNLTGPQLLGHQEERVTFATKALEAMSHITSQLLIQSETISNMHTAWSQLSEQVTSKNLETQPDTDLQYKEADVGIPNPSTLAYDDIQAVDARALLIRSRPDLTGAEGSESETEEFLGGQLCKISSTNLGCVRYESDESETLNEISLVRRLGSDIHISNVQVKDTTSCPSLQGAIMEDNFTAELSKLEKGKSPDMEDDSGWEHVLLPQSEVE